MPTAPEKLEELKKRKSEIRWYHSIDLGSELGFTRPVDSTEDHIRWTYMNPPGSFEGLNVLDVGAWDGFFSFAAERRGAAHVLATDIWEDYYVGNIDMVNRGDGIRFAIEALNSSVQVLYADVYSLAEEIWDQDSNYTADIVLCPGVLYHLKNPLLALQEIHKVLAPHGLLILETHLDLLDIERPAIALYRGTECAGDETNYCGPNPAAVETLLEWAKFHAVQFKGGVRMKNWRDQNSLARGAWHARKA